MRAFKLLIVTIVIVLSAFTQRVGSLSYNLNPSCDHLEPTPCKIITSKDSRGEDDYRYYVEECSRHTCTRINPNPSKAPDESFYSTPVSELLFSKSRPGTPISKPNTQYRTWWSKDQEPELSAEEEEGRKQRAYRHLSKYWDPTVVSTDAQGKFTRADVGATWFCAGGQGNNSDDQTLMAGVNYDARVSTDTQRSLGLTEDMKAHCEFLRFMDLFAQTSCDYLTQGCAHPCLSGIRAFLCAMYFPKCKPAPGNYYGTGINQTNNRTKEMYIPNNLPADVNISDASYIIQKPCRQLCFGPLQKCPREMSWTCPVKEARDYGDSPDCNSVNSLK